MSNRDPAWVVFWWARPAFQLPVDGAGPLFFVWVGAAAHVGPVPALLPTPCTPLPLLTTAAANAITASPCHFLQVKVQTIKTSIEAATLLLRIDDIVSGLKKRDKLAPGQAAARGPEVDDGENVDSERMLQE